MIRPLYNNLIDVLRESQSKQWLCWTMFFSTWAELAFAEGHLRCHGADLIKPLVWFNPRSYTKCWDFPFTVFLSFSVTAAVITVVWPLLVMSTPAVRDIDKDMCVCVHLQPVCVLQVQMCVWHRGHCHSFLLHTVTLHPWMFHFHSQLSNTLICVSRLNKALPGDFGTSPYRPSADVPWMPGLQAAVINGPCSVTSL